MVSKRSTYSGRIDELLFVNPDYVTPETGLVPVAGDEKTQEQAGHVVYEPIYAHIGEGSILTFGGAAEAVAVVESGTGLFALSTSPAFIGNTYRFCWKWDASGNLPIIGGAAESRTYDYSDELLQPFTQVDNGLISAATTTTDDNGSIVLTNYCRRRRQRQYSQHRHHSCSRNIHS